MAGGDLGSRGGVTSGGNYTTASGQTLPAGKLPPPPSRSGGRTGTEQFLPGGSSNPWLDVTDLFGDLPSKDPRTGKTLRHRVVMELQLLMKLGADPTMPLYYTRTNTGAVQFSATRTRGARGAGTLGQFLSRGPMGRRVAIVQLQHWMELMGAYSPSSPPTYGVWTPEDAAAVGYVFSAVQKAGLTASQPTTRVTTTDITGARPKKTTTVDARTVYEFGSYLKNNALETQAQLERQQQWQISTAAARPVPVTSAQAVGNEFDNTFRQLVGRAPTAAERTQFVAAYRADEIRYGRAMNAASGGSAQTGAQESRIARDRAFEQAQIDPFIRYNGQRVAASDVPVADRARVAAMYPGLDFARIDEFYRTNPRGGGARNAGIGLGPVIEEPNLTAAAVAAAKRNPMYMPNQIGEKGQDVLRLLMGGGGPVGAMGVQGG